MPHKKKKKILFLATYCKPLLGWLLSCYVVSIRVVEGPTGLHSHILTCTGSQWVVNLSGSTEIEWSREFLLKLHVRQVIAFNISFFNYVSHNWSLSFACLLDLFHCSFCRTSWLALLVQIAVSLFQMCVIPLVAGMPMPQDIDNCIVHTIDGLGTCPNMNSSISLYSLLLSRL